MTSYSYQIVRDEHGLITRIDGNDVPPNYRDPTLALPPHEQCWSHCVSATILHLWPSFTEDQMAALAADAWGRATAQHAQKLSAQALAHPNHRS